MLSSYKISFNKNKAIELQCSAYSFGKSHRFPFLASKTCANEPLVIIHSDVWVSPITSPNGFKYYVHFTDEHLRFTWLYFLKTKDGVYNAFIQFKAVIELQLNTKIKVFQLD